MEVVRSEKQASRGEAIAALLVADVDNDPRKSTPVAEWNIREERQAKRSEEEQHASLAIKPGDEICAVNGTSGDDDAMVELLASAASFQSPKAVNIRLQRARSDVLGPASPQQARAAGGRRRTDPEVRQASPRPESGAWADAAARRSRSSSMTGRLRPPACDRRGRMEDDSSTRSPSVLSGRSSHVSGSGSERDPPLVIQSKRRSQFSRAGLASLTM